MHIEFDQRVTIGAVVLLVAAFVGLGWLPRHLERGELEAHIEARRAQLGVDRKGAEGFGDLRERVEQLRGQAATANKVVPATSELADLLRRITSQMAAHDLHDQEIQTEAIIEGQDFNVIPLTLRFSGSYDGLFAFVRGVESMSRLTRINVLEVTGVPTKPTEPVAVRIDLTTFSAAGGTRGDRP